jgi:hypothetical protein
MKAVLIYPNNFSMSSIYINLNLSKLMILSLFYPNSSLEYKYLNSNF